MHTEGIDFEVYAESILVQDAVAMRLQTIGELFKRLTPLGRDDPYGMEKIFPAGMLRGMKSMRDFIAHHYTESEISYAWDTVKNEIPKMKKIICELLDSCPDMKIGAELNRDSFWTRHENDVIDFLRNNREIPNPEQMTP